MSRKLPIRVIRSAAAQIEEASAWWEVSRPKAPGSLRQEIERAFELISTQPRIGAGAANIRLAGVRRIHLSRIHYHLCYRVKESPQAVEVLALWHAGRGSGPAL